MAVTVTHQGVIIDEADATTGWASPVSGETINLFTADPDPVEDSGCLGIAVSTEVSEVVHQISAADYSDHLIYVWVIAAGTMETLANVGIAMFLSDDTDDIAYALAGSDVAAFRHEEGPVTWQCLVLDTTNPPSIFDVIAGVEANLNFDALTEIGAQFETLSKALGGASNCFVDIIRVAAAGEGLLIIGGTSGDVGTFDEIATEDRSNTTQKAFGILRKLGNQVFGCQGPLTFGDSSGVTAHWFEDLGFTINFEDRGLAAGRYSIVIVGNSTGIGHLELGVKIGTGDDASGVQGGVFVAPSAQGALLDADNADMDVVLLYGCQFVNFNTADGLRFSADVTNGPNHEVMGTLFLNCGQCAAGRVIMRDNTFDSYVGSEGGALLWNANINIKNSAFQNCSEGIEHPVAGTFSYVGLKFSGNTVDVNNSANAVNEIALAFAGIDGTIDLDDTNNGAGQSVTIGGTNRQLSSMRFELDTTGSPTGTIEARLYSDAAGVPGTLLATSDPINASAIPAAPGNVDFSFNDADEQFLMLATVKYHAVVVYTAGTATDYISVGVDSGGGLAGDSSILNGSWVAGGVQDVPVELRYDGIATINASGGADPATVKNTGTPPGATVINNPVTHTVSNLRTGDRVIWMTDPGEVELNNEVEVGGVATHQYNYSGDQNVFVQVLSGDFTKKNTVTDIVLGSTDADFPAVQADDPTYDNP